MNLTGTKPIQKTTFKEFLAFVGIFLLIGLVLCAGRTNIEEQAVREYLEDNYESIYNEAYNDG